ncbi:MAG: DUF4190 domain-containing protein [Lachnospiraceae bacterium]|nr:DUF4190 domain-containing protein [Lachnospiraceae bacterium]
MYCTTCGKELPDDASVCDECQTVFPSGVQTEESETADSDRQGCEPENGRRPYLNYRPFSGTYESRESEQSDSWRDDYRQAPHGQGGYSQYPESSPGQTGFSIASLVLGILAVCSCCLPIITIPLGILAVIFAVLGMKSINRGLAIAGLILGILALVLGLMMFVILLLSSDGFYHLYQW